MIEKLINKLDDFSDRKIQYFLKHFLTNDLMNVMYYYPEEMGSKIQHNMSKRSYEMLENDTEIMNKPSIDELEISIKNGVDLIDSYTFQLRWDTLLEKNNETHNENDELHIPVIEKFNIKPENELTFSYYMNLIEKFNNNTLTDIEKHDLNDCEAKFNPEYHFGHNIEYNP